MIAGIIEGVRDSWRHLTGADPMTLLMLVAGVILVAYFLLKR